MCSIRNAPTGMIPVREWRRRSRKECPWPARRGGTPPGIAVAAFDFGAVLAGVGAIERRALPDTNKIGERTFHYRVARMFKSRLARVADLIGECFPDRNKKLADLYDQENQRPKNPEKAEQ